MILRRQFMRLFLVSATCVWPLAAHAQRRTTPVVGLLNSAPIDASQAQIDAFRQGLAESGFVEGRNVIIEYRSSQNQNSQLPSLAAQLVRISVDVIAATGSSAPGLAAKGATSTIPIVFQTGGDPVSDGLVPSLNRPGGNITGVSRLSAALGPKRLELLHELIPNATKIALLLNPTSPVADYQLQDMQEPSRSLGLNLHVLRATTEKELDAAFANLTGQGDQALLVTNDPSFNSWRQRLVALSARYAVPTLYASREFNMVGGLMSYAASLLDSYRQVGVYAGRILKGEKPADLPVLLPTKFELVINLKTAKALGLEISPKLLALADEVIEE